MSIMKIKKGDEVKIVRGKDAGKTGKVERVFPDKKTAVVAGINLFKKHKKSITPRQRSEIITVTKPLSIANVMLICPKCKLTTRIGFSFDQNKKARICKRCKQVI